MLWYVGNGLFFISIQKEATSNSKKTNMSSNLKKMYLTV